MYVCIEETEARRLAAVFVRPSNQMNGVYVCMYCLVSVYVGVVVWAREEEKKQNQTRQTIIHTYSYTLIK